MTHFVVLTAAERKARDLAADAVDMGTDLAGVALPNPVLTASGCAAAGQELSAFFDVTTLGAVVTKSIMAEPRSGRPTPRMAETPSGMLNSIGLQGPGIETFLDQDLRWLAERGARTVVSIAGGTVAEFAALADRLSGNPAVSAVEVNISCPNVANRGLVFACDPHVAARVLSAVRQSMDRDTPVFAKLSPDVTDIVAIARACVEAGADGLSLINTLLGMVIDPVTMRPALGGITGGLSGPAIRPVAVRCLWQVHRALPRVPLIGMGGIRTGQDALELVLAGASAVSVGTTIFNDPSAPVRVLAELRMALAERGFTRFADAVGYAHRGPDEPAAPDTDAAPHPAATLGAVTAPGPASVRGPATAPGPVTAPYLADPTVVDVREGEGPPGDQLAEPPRVRSLFEDREIR